MRPDTIALIEAHRKMANQAARRVMWWDQQEAESCANYGLFQAGLYYEREGGEFGAIARVAVKRATIDEIRRQFGRSRVQERLRDIAPVSPFKMAEHMASCPFESDIEVQDLIQRLPLTPQERAVVTMCLADRMQEDIGEALEVTASRVSQILRGARTKLRDAMAA